MNTTSLTPWIHPNLKLLSNSSNVLLHKCPRKFMLYKLLKLPVDESLESNIDFDFGHWVGIGIQELLSHGDMNKAMWKMFLSHKGDFDDEERRERSKKTFGHALIALARFEEFRQTEIQDYDLIPGAIELGFTLTCIDGFTYRGFFDALLIHRYTRELTVLECKTTKSNRVHEASYKNSGQGLGYSLVTDAIAQSMRDAGEEVSSSFHVIYPVYKAGDRSWEKFEFQKTNSQRAGWLRDLLVDIKQIVDYVEADHFPMRGESCFDFFRPCEYLDICDLNKKYLLGDIEKIDTYVEDEGKYKYKFDLLQLVQSQQEKLQEVTSEEDEI